MMWRRISEVPSQIRSTRASHQNRASGRSLIRPMPPAFSPLFGLRDLFLINGSPWYAYQKQWTGIADASLDPFFKFSPMCCRTTKFVLHKSPSPLRHEFFINPFYHAALALGRIQAELSQVIKTFDIMIDCACHHHRNHIFL